jgi:hypothetical protein
MDDDPIVNEALRLTGDIAWEHDCEEGAKSVYRVMYWRLRPGRESIRCSEWFGYLCDAEDAVDRINAADDKELISIRHYRWSP